MLAVLLALALGTGIGGILVFVLIVLAIIWLIRHF